VDVSQVVNAVSDRYRLDPDLVSSVIRAESGFKVHAVSPKGAQGLMQLMPGTASKLGVPNAFDPEANVDGGTRYLRELLERYNFDLIKALAAYNAGPHRVEQYKGVPPYLETRKYVASIVRDFNRKKLAQQKAATPAAARVPAQNRAKAQPEVSKPATKTARTAAAVTKRSSTATGN
jgi:soluble lytic murein transglycosylase-like protein